MCIYKQNTGCTESSPEGKSMVAMMAHVRAGAEMGLGREGVGEKEGLIPGEWVCVSAFLYYNKHSQEINLKRENAHFGLQIKNKSLCMRVPALICMYVHAFTCL